MLSKFKIFYRHFYRNIFYFLFINDLYLCDYWIVQSDTNTNKDKNENEDKTRNNIKNTTRNKLRKTQCFSLYDKNYHKLLVDNFFKNKQTQSKKKSRKLEQTKK